MSRTGWSFVAGLALILAGLIVSTAMPTGVAPTFGTALFIVGLALLATLAFVAAVRARRSRGWTRVWNPGAARREYMAERDARARSGSGTPETKDDRPHA